MHFANRIIDRVLEHGLPNGISLNVNIPEGHLSTIKGIKICRQNKGVWREEFDKRLDPQNREYYWLTGEFHNLEPESRDTDQWALLNGYVSVVPVLYDLTCYSTLQSIKDWNF